MHLLTIIAFAILLWHGEQPGEWVLVREGDVFWTMAFVLVQPAALALAAVGIATRAKRLLIGNPTAPDVAQQFHHRSNFVLRCVIAVGFAATVFLTRWPEWFAFSRISPVLQIVGDLIVLSPFVANLLILWITGAGGIGVRNDQW